MKRGFAIVELDQERWDTPFTIAADCGESSPQSLDLILDPAAGRPF